MLGACASGPPPRDNALLNDGYSLLYETASTLRFEDDLVLLKIKTERFKLVIDDISSYSAQLKGGLERIARDYPAVRIDLQPLPEIEVARRTAAARAIVLASAPIIGRSGAVFERSLLLSNAGGLDHTRHLCQVMAEAETDPNLKRFMQNAEQHFSALYDEVVVLLDQAHFRQNFKQQTGGSR